MLDVEIGKDVTTQEPVRLRYEERPLGVALIGKTGTGKSSVLERLILADLTHGTAGVAIDPHGQLAERVISLAPPQVVERIVLVESSRIAPFGLNLLACREPVEEYDEPDVWAASSVVQTFKKLYGESDNFQPRFERYLGLAARTLIAANRTLIDGTRLFHDESFRRRCIQSTNDTALRSTLERRWADFESLRPADQAVQAEAVVNRLERLFEPRAMQYMLGSRRTTIPFQSVLSGNAFIIVSLPSERLGEEWCDYIGSMFLCTLADRLFARRLVPKPPRVHIYLDEYQRFETKTTEKFLTEGRKYNIGVTLAHQTRGQIRDVRGSDAELQARTLIVLAVTRQDADVLAGELPVSQREEWIERIEVEDGTEPVLIPTRTPLEHLRNGGGHRNQRVVDAARTLFVPADQSVPRSSFEKVDPVCVPSRNAQLDQLLVDVMDGVSRSDSTFRDRLFNVLFTLERGNKRLFPLQDQYAHVLAPYWLKIVSHEPDKLHTLWPDWPRTIQETVTKEVQRWFDEYLDRKSGLIEQNRETSSLLDRQDADLLDAVVRLANKVIAAHGGRKLMFDLEYTIGYLKHMIGVYRKRLRCLLILCDGLFDDPILVPSGQERPRTRVQLITHPRQTEQDARNELAARLVNLDLDKEYVAHVKLPTSFHMTALRLPFEPDGTGCSVEAARQRSRERYAMRKDDFPQDDDGEEPPSIGRRT